MRRTSKALKFILVLNLLVIPLYASFVLNISFPLIERILANFVYEVISRIMEGVELVGNTLVKDGNIFSVTFDCSGWKSTYFLLSLYLAYRISTNQKSVKGIPLLMGVVAVLLLNFLRLLFLSYVALEGYFDFKVVHATSQLLLLSFVLAYWWFFLLPEKVISRAKHI